MHGRGERVYKVWVGKPEGKRPLGRVKWKSEDGIGMEWILGRLAGWVRIGFDWLRIRMGGELL
jgi:hypothetical protein